MSISKWVSTIVIEKTSGQWPDEVLALVGARNHFRSLEEVPAGVGQDTPRESF